MYAVAEEMKAGWVRGGSQRGLIRITATNSGYRGARPSATSRWRLDYPKLFPVFTLKCRFFCSLVLRAPNPLKFKFKVRVKGDFQMLANLPFFLLCDALPNSIVHFWVWTREIAVWILLFKV